jgi:hypothetical protein
MAALKVFEWMFGKTALGDAVTTSTGQQGTDSPRQEATANHSRKRSLSETQPLGTQRDKRGKSSQTAEDKEDPM